MRKSVIVILVSILSLSLLGLFNEVSADMVQIDDSYSYYEDFNFIQVELGYAHSIAITSERRVFTWGNNSFGQLGDGTTTDRLIPTEITSNFNLNTGEIITSVLLGKYHSSAITSEGRVFAWGRNLSGRLGDGTTTDRSTPTEITSNFNLNIGETITSMSLGQYHSSAITSEGRVFTWGQNYYGQLGDGTTTNRLIPTEITSNFNLNAGETITGMSLGYFHSSAITSDGRVFIWGQNYYGELGQLGDGTTTNRSTPTEITSNFNLNAGETIISISLGAKHSSAITSERRVFTWGNNSFGQLGDETSYMYRSVLPTEITSNFYLNIEETITSVLLGHYHSSAITSEGRIFTWGYNDNSQLGDGTKTDKNTPMEIGVNYISSLQIYLPISETIASMSVGEYHSSAITSEGRIFTWGLNDKGQLGNGTISDKSAPIEITSNFNLNTGETITSMSLGLNHSSAISSEGRAFTWGSNYYGQLGHGTFASKSTPTEITSNFNLNTGETITSISLGEFHSSAITSDGRIFTWGRNDMGQVGNGAINTRIVAPTEITSNFNLNIGETITSISLGHKHSSAITSEQRVFTWGDNEIGQLGYGTTAEYRYTPTEITSNFNLNTGETIINISLGGDHSSAITSEGRIFAWGFNGFGQLGIGTATNYEPNRTPIEITSNFNLNTGETITSMSLGYTHTSAISSEGRVFTWGSNSGGRLGDGTIVSKYMPTEITSSFILNTGETIIGMPLGYTHTSAITSEGRIFTWGRNNTRQLGDGTIIDRSIPTKINYNLLEDNNILSTYMEDEINGRKSTIKLSIFLEYDFGNLLDIITINEVDYDSTYFDVGFGRIDVYIPNIWNIGDTIILSVDSFEFIDNQIVIPTGDLEASTVLVEDVFPPTITFDYEYNLFIQENIGDISYIAAESIDDTGEILDITLTGEVDWNTPGQYILMYTSIDTYGNNTFRIRTVNILEDTSVSGTTVYDMTFNYFDDETYSDTTDLSNQFVIYQDQDYFSYSDYSNYVYNLELNIIEFEFIVDNRFVLVAKEVFFEDLVSPTFDVIIDQTIEAGVSDIDWTTLITNGVDNSDGILIKVEVTDNVDYDTLGTYTVTVKLVDESLNETSQEFNVVVEDITSPIFDVIADQIIEAGVSDIDWTTSITNELDNSDGTLTKVEITDNVDYDTPGTYTVTIKLADESLNETSQEFNVTVEDTTSPTFDEIVDQTIGIGVSNIDWTTLITNELDNSDGILSKIEVTSNVDYDTLGAYTVTVKLVDESLNETSQEFNVTVEDITAPSFDPILDQTIEAGVSDIDWTTLIINESDNLDGVLSKLEVEDNVNYNTPGTYTVTVKLVDGYLNETAQEFNVIVEDTTVPSCDPILDQTIEAGISDIDWTSLITNESDNSNSNIFLKEYLDFIDYNTLGTYGVILTVGDESSNVRFINIYVTVEDTTAPSFDEILEQTIEAGVSDIDWTTLIINELDNSDGVLSKFEVEDNVDYDALGTYTVIVKLVDESLNETTHEFNVIVEDTTIPVITLTGDAIVYVEYGGTYTENGATFIDNFDPSGDATVGGDTVDTSVIGTYTITYNVTDSEGNIALEVTRTVIVQDKVSPVLSLNPSIDSISVGDEYIDYGVDVIYDGTVTTVVTGTVDTSTAGVYILTYTVTDESGNETVIVRYVTVSDIPTVEFILGNAATSIKVGDTYTDGTCEVLINGISNTCTVKSNTVDTTIEGIYTITYSYTYLEIEYTYDRYIYVYVEGTQLTLYYRKEEELM